jgi:hypothetical protein
MGYYTLYTSEIDKTDEEILQKYRGLSRIEDSFRVTKTDIEGRPVYVRTPEHINAHFLICFTALVMVRLIQFKILKYQGKDTIANSEGWESGLSAERIQHALNSWNATPLNRGYYTVNKPEEDLQLILDAFGIKWDWRLPEEKMLRKLKSEFNKVISEWLVPR